MLEVDANRNLLPGLCRGPVGAVNDGQATLSDRPCLGTEPDEAACGGYWWRIKRLAISPTS